MHEKNIKIMVRKQLKEKFPHWNKFNRKEKKALARQVLAEVEKEYDFGQKVTVPLPELTGVPEINEQGIMTLAEMERFVTERERRLIKLPSIRERYIQDAELRAVSLLLDDDILNLLLAPPGYTPYLRTIHPAHLMRAELLKSLKCAGLTYRQYCPTQLDSLERKTYRAFVGLPLNRRRNISHSQLSQFRTGLAFSQMVNFIVYILHLLISSGRMDRRWIVGEADSSELPAICNPVPLATLKIGDKKQVRIYADLDADCGTRRNKRDKSKYFVGYRMHTLAAIDSRTGQSYPIISLIAPGNHHDNLLLKQLVHLSKAIGLELKVIITDEGYGDAEQNQEIQQEYGVTVIHPPQSKVHLPESVDPQSRAVYRDKCCDIPMTYLGKTDTGAHEFTCGDETGECLLSAVCSKCREIPQDAGYFGVIPNQVSGVKELNQLRKHAERPFNLLKHREGLEPLRVRSQHGVMAVATIACAANLLLEIVATRKTKPKEVSPQLRLKEAA